MSKSIRPAVFLHVLLIGVCQQSLVLSQQHVVGNQIEDNIVGNDPGILTAVKSKKIALPKYNVSVKKYTIKKQRNLIRVPITSNEIPLSKPPPTFVHPRVVLTTLPPPTSAVAANKVSSAGQSFSEECDCPSMQKEIDFLKEESRNLNFRVSQLYVQLLQEIINKRDDSLRFTDLQNQLLNETVRHYQLREMHHELREIVLNMGNTLVEQRQLIRDLQQVRPIMNSSPPKRVIAVSPLVSSVGSRVVYRPLPDVPLDITTTTTTPTKIPEENPILGGPYEDCVSAQQYGHDTSGRYLVQLQQTDKQIIVWCDFSQDPGGWLVIQRRSLGKINFYRNMASYKKGFGSIEGDFWLGLENIHRITNRPMENYKLHIDLEDWDGRKTFVEYRSFRITGEDDGYRLKISHYSGDAGDSLAWHNNMKFTTKNVDNDPFVKNCANFQKGGWWYNSCAHSNLNGIYYSGGHYRSEYQDGIFWSEWRGGSYSLKSVEMKIMPTE